MLGDGSRNGFSFGAMESKNNNVGDGLSWLREFSQLGLLQGWMGLAFVFGMMFGAEKRLSTPYWETLFHSS